MPYTHVEKHENVLTRPLATDSNQLYTQAIYQIWKVSFFMKSFKSKRCQINGKNKFLDKFWPNL